MGKKAQKTRLVAHRGFSSQELENTLPSFLLACKEDGFAGVECDVQVTKDGKFVIFHDRDLKRMCGVDKKIKNLTLAEVLDYPLMNKSGVLDYRYHIPTFEQYLEVCKSYNKICFIEIKSHMTFTHVKNLLEIVKREEYLQNCIFISFHFHCLASLRILSKEAIIEHICDYKIKKIGWLCKKFRIGIDYKYSIIKKQEIEAFKKLGLTTNAWTVNDKDTAKQLMSYKIDFITSNSTLN